MGIAPDPLGDPGGVGQGISQTETIDPKAQNIHMLGSCHIVFHLSLFSRQNIQHKITKY
jgi:hypothetical protein